MREVGPLTVSPVGLGCNNFGRSLDAAETRDVVLAALDSGVTFFDTADKYGGTRSEEYLGKALRGRREQAVVATKVGLAVDEDPAHTGASRRWITEAVEHSLRRLGTDWIDLYQLHRPDPEIPVEETMGAFDELVRAGKVRALGICNASLDEIAAYRDVARAEGLTWLVTSQDEFSLLRRQVQTDGRLAQCGAEGLGFLPFYPLASGLLTGKHRRGVAPAANTRLAQSTYAGQYEEQDWRRAEALQEWCAERGWELLDLAVSWLLAQPAVASVICGASRPEQVRRNAVAHSLRLTAEDLAAVDALTLEETVDGRRSDMLDPVDSFNETVS